MAISKTGGISLSEIKANLKGTDGISSYKNIAYLNSSTNNVAYINGPALSFSSFNNLTEMPLNDPSDQTFNLLSSTASNTSINQNAGDAGLSVTVDVIQPQTHPILLYTPVYTVIPTVKWYETTGGAHTLVSTNSQLVLPSGEASIRVSSQFIASDDVVGTRTFVAVVVAVTNGLGADGEDLGIKKTSQQQIANYSVKVVSPPAPVITSHTRNGGTQTTSDSIITYTDGVTAISYPALGIPFNYTFAEGSSPGWIKTNRSESHVSYVSFDGGGWVASTASGVGPYGPFHQSHDPTRSPSEFGYWVRSPIKFTTPGEYRFKLVSSLSVTFTKPDGTPGYVITATDESIHTTTIGSETVDNAVPTMLGWSIAEDSVTEDGGVATATLSTQHAIGEEISLTASENFGNNMKIWTKQKITANSMTFKFTSKKRNHGADRTLTLRAEPVGTWNDNTRVSDTVTLTNSGAPAIIARRSAGAGTGINKTSVNEGGSMTFTLKGINFTQENYTWTTTFPAAAVSATSGSFTTPYAGNYYTGNYQGSFTIDTVDRPSHYADVTGGRVKIYRDGILYTQTGGLLKIKNTHAEPATLPTALVSTIAGTSRGGKNTNDPFNGTVSVSLTLNNDGSYTVGRTGSYVGNTADAGTYSSPAPLEGTWIPKITQGNQITSNTTQEDINWNQVPSGGAVASINFSNSTATLTVKALKLFSSIHSSNCGFNWVFYNTTSGATRPGGTISLNVHVICLPTHIDIGIGGEDGNGGAFDIVTLDSFELLEVEPGFDVPTVTYEPSGTFKRQYCVGTTLKGVYADGTGGTYHSVIAYNSPTCGYVAVQPVKTTVYPSTTDAQIAAAIKYLEENPIDFTKIDFSNININFSM